MIPRRLGADDGLRGGHPRGTNDEVTILAAKRKSDPAKEIGEMKELFT